MRELCLIVQTSLDGFVAGADGAFTNFVEGEENLAFVCSITDEADAALFGRVSFQLLNSHWPRAGSEPGASENAIKYSNWYNAVPKYVLSKSLEIKDPNTVVISEDIETQILDIKKQPGKSILIFGSPTAVQSLLDLKLLDSFWMIVHPVMFGQGIPFFRERKDIIKLELIASKQLANGTLCQKYLLSK